ncbi:hypothetical protein G647_06059 [Cladophialophora carrionii CBS 160.54]|uniref:Condensation domain-containing protein n=1 Tax=Cladophialophora carrionii CBS 160.54 TaxID=1279043 RepID=V9D516_9EURO|nr:uncharacterized protein G647_06059 [Cladophialophora carrionii CBS 160.54]ETI21989.1 hypothetical protein G647_06059 [Cladophialophora carrionii CBS 160.54]
MAMAELPNGTGNHNGKPSPKPLAPSNNPIDDVETHGDLRLNNSAKNHDMNGEFEGPQINGDHIHLNGSVSDPNANHLHASLEVDRDIEPYHHPGSDHVIRLSGIEHCMPRSYIRICLAYRLPRQEMLGDVVTRLNHFVRETVNAKPYLSGYVVAVENPGNRVGAVEIRFSDTDFLEYPDVGVRHLTREEVPYTYDQLCEDGLRPSVIKPEIVSALGESADEDRAPAFRVQANVVEGGIIVSVYLHHCISDGNGAEWLISGNVLRDDFAFKRDLDGGDHDIPSLSMRLDTFARHKSQVRSELSYSSANQINDRHLKYKTVQAAENSHHVIKPIGRGCVFAIPLTKLADLKQRLMTLARAERMSRSDVLMTLIWHGMTKARIPSLSQNPTVTTSKLNIPVNIRTRIKNKLPESYFGAAVDFASVEAPLFHFADNDDASMCETALAIRKAINQVTEPYIRQSIALAENPNPKIDVRDLQGSNMDRTDGADMYITSWEKLKLYDATFDMGLGRPDWVRKPWSRDPGSCIVLPFDDRKDYLEVVIQMAEADMGRLLEDKAFMGYVDRWIE